MCHRVQQPTTVVRRINKDRIARRNQNVTLMCHCDEDQEHCHRHLLKRVLTENLRGKLAQTSLSASTTIAHSPTSHRTDGASF